MNLKRKRIVASAAITALATAVFLSFLLQSSHLILTNAHDGTALMSTRVYEGTEFSVSYTHSVNISLVTEIFRVQQGAIVLQALEFYSFGAGMPTEPEPGQTLITLPDGGMRIEGFDRTMDNLTFLIAFTANHTLHIESQEIPLQTLDFAGQPVRFEVVRQNIWQRLGLFRT